MDEEHAPAKFFSSPKMDEEHAPAKQITVI